MFLDTIKYANLSQNNRKCIKIWLLNIYKANYATKFLYVNL